MAEISTMDSKQYIVVELGNEQYGIDIFNEQMIDELLGYLRNREAKTIGGAIELRNKIKLPQQHTLVKKST